MDQLTNRRVDRREFLTRAAKASILGLAFPSVLQACGRERPAGDSATVARVFSAADYKAKTERIQGEAEVLNGDVLDFRLTSRDWEGVFGFVKMRLHPGAVDGGDVFYVRTDASDEPFAMAERLVFVPKLAALAAPDLAGSVFVVSGGIDGQPAVFSTEPGRDDYTPAWRVSRVSWMRAPRRLTSVGEIASAESAGDVAVERTSVVLNAPIVKWSSGEMPVDRELKGYLGQGHVIEGPDTTNLTITFKLNECFPATRYFVTDHSIGPAAEMTRTVFAPRLHRGPSSRNATGRTNVLMNGLEGPGPMGFQPSAFDLPVGDPGWSPFWDHYSYRWKDPKKARLLTSQAEVHRARDAGDLEEFPGVPDTKGEVFTVNCPAPVSAPNVFAA